MPMYVVFVSMSDGACSLAMSGQFGPFGPGFFCESACYYIMRALALLAAALPSPALSRVASLPLPLVADRQLDDRPRPS